MKTTTEQNNLHEVLEILAFTRILS